MVLVKAMNASNLVMSCDTSHVWKMIFMMTNMSDSSSDSESSNSASDVLVLEETFVGELSENVV